MVTASGRQRHNASSPPSSQPLRIVVTSTFSDAHMWNLVYLQRMLEERGAEVLNLGACAPDELILTECRRTKPDLLVVSTVNGHGHIDAIDLIRKIREDTTLAPLNVVIGGRLGIDGAGGLAATLTASGYDAVFDSGSISAFERYLDAFTATRVQVVADGHGPISDTARPRQPPGRAGAFSRFVAGQRRRGALVLQPRMGLSDVAAMRSGLERTKNVSYPTIGTITVDSYTRVNDHDSARRALARGHELNGFPVVAHGVHTVAELISTVHDAAFPIQVRHGSALPNELLRTVAEAGIYAAEGGPVSYCLPYSRVPLVDAVRAWEESCQLLADLPEPFHMECFGGCMQGQLCPPELLIALSVLEGMFFREQGLTSISLSYAQQTHFGQDLEALAALRKLAREFLDDTDWHVVLYTYMGVFPRTPTGTHRILEESVRLAVRSDTERLIVKTPAEAHRIPTVADNVDALEFAGAVAEAEFERPVPVDAPVPETGIHREAMRLIEATLDGSDRVGLALVRAFQAGRLDVPYCLHRDNANQARTGLDADGRLYWADSGRMPLSPKPVPISLHDDTSRGLLHMLHYNQRRFDDARDENAAVRGLAG